MSSLLRNLAKAGTVIHSKGIFRAGGAAIGIEFGYQFPFQTFVNRIIKKEQVVLYRTGRAMLREYKKVLGKAYPKMRTTKGKRSARYVREIVKGARHPYPYMKTGILRNATEFYVDEDSGEVLAGPIRLSGHAWGRVRSSKPVPQLLEEGGSATVTIPARMKIVRKGKRTVRKQTQAKQVSVMYRSFAYKAVPKALGIKTMTSDLAKVEL